MENLSVIVEPMQSEEIGKLAIALSKAQGEMSGANKSSDNPFFKSKYADLNTCIEAAREPLSKNELAVIQTTEPHDNGIMIVTTLAHSSGQWIKGKLLMNPKKDDDQGRGSSITYGRRYAFAAIVGLAQKDDDGNAASGNTKKQETDMGQWLKWVDGFVKLDEKSLDKGLESVEMSISGFSKADRKRFDDCVRKVRGILQEKEAS